MPLKLGVTGIFTILNYNKNMSFNSMKFSFNSIFLLLNLFYSPILLSAGLDKNYESTWHGIEVVGTDSVTAEKIRALQPITIGEKFRVSERKYYSEKCQQLIKKICLLKKSIALLSGMEIELLT